MLNLESEVNQRPWFNNHWGYYFVTGFLFSCNKASDASIGIIDNFVYLEKPDWLVCC